MASDQLEWNFGRCQNQLRYRTNLLTDARDVIFDRDQQDGRSSDVRFAPEAEVKSGYRHLVRWASAVDRVA